MIAGEQHSSITAFPCKTDCCASSGNTSRGLDHPRWLLWDVSYTRPWRACHTVAVHPLVGIEHQQLKVLRRLLGKRESRSAHQERNRGWTLGEECRVGLGYVEHLRLKRVERLRGTTHRNRVVAREMK